MPGTFDSQRSVSVVIASLPSPSPYPAIGTLRTLASIHCGAFCISEILANVDAASARYASAYVR